ncbi:uncharacterized protein LOC124941680 [Impatiens glandulifera]|uniref:uncharacterized protein LOC124941680 n=1 Tax=Impatiens glandulifera TaxID=253017 RepID=UPI001FB1093D|nr:uncharacterized protein LOC124941680 [Impatiens glandulifera]
MALAKPEDLHSQKLRSNSPISRSQSEAKPMKSVSYSSHENSNLQDVLLVDSKSSAAAAAIPCISSDLTIFSNPSHHANKKTRDLPNVSDCHGCGCHINVTNHKDRLQTLDSFWRIVLLCWKCIRGVESAELCSYCLSPAKDEADCFLCCDCRRRVHKDCVTKYRYSPPWCYSHSNSDFRVCIDCWIPKLLTKSNSLYEKKGLEKKQPLKMPTNLRSQKSLKDVVKDAKLNMNDKMLVAEKAKDNKLRKALLAKRAVEFASDALELVAAKSFDSGNKASTNGDHTGLAFQLQRVLNKSPRIAENFCSLNSTFLSLNRDSMEQESKVYVRRHKKVKNEEPQQDAIRSQGLLAWLESSRVPPDGICNEEKPHHRVITYTKRLAKEARVNNVLNLYESGKQTEPVLDSFSNDSKSPIQLGDSEEIPTVLSKEKSYKKGDRFGFSYTKRSANGIISKDESLAKQAGSVQELFLDKPVSHVKSNGNEESDDRYALKYTKRPVKL